MAQEKFEIIRQPIAVRAHSRRHLEERLALRFPRALTFLGRAVWRLPPRSRLRQALLRRAMRLALEATNRGDYEATFGALYDPDCEAIYPAKMVAVGGQPRTLGREARSAFKGSGRPNGPSFDGSPKS
jgi:hypothetical protein